MSIRPLVLRRGLALLAPPVLMAAVLAIAAAAPTPGPPAPDTTPPAAVRDLRIAQTRTGEAGGVGRPGAPGETGGVTWAFTATGDDGTTGRAARYELYYAPNGWDKIDNLVKGQVARWPLSKWQRFAAEIPTADAGAEIAFDAVLPESPASETDRMSGPKFYQSYWMLVAYDRAGNAARSRPALEVELFARTCSAESGCHDDAWPHESGRHEKHVQGNKFKCVICHRDAVTPQWALLERHDNKQRDLRFWKAPDRAVFDAEQESCLQLCHEPRSWKAEPGQ